MKENKEFYVTIQGNKVIVNEEVYREYVRPIRAIQRQQRRAWKCRIVGRKGNLIRCPYKCEECPYAIAGNLPTGNVLSLDIFKKLGVEIEDKRWDIERDYIEGEERVRLYEQLHNAIKNLPHKQRLVIEVFYFEGASQEEIAKTLGVQQPAVSKLLARGLQGIKTFLGKF